MKFRKIRFSTETLPRGKGNGTFPCGKFHAFRLGICIKTGRPLEQWSAQRAGQQGASRCAHQPSSLGSELCPAPRRRSRAAGGGGARRGTGRPFLLLECKWDDWRDAWDDPDDCLILRGTENFTQGPKKLPPALHAGPCRKSSVPGRLRLSS